MVEHPLATLEYRPFLGMAWFVIPENVCIYIPLGLQPAYHNPSDDSITNDNEWGYAMKLGVTPAFLEFVYFVNCPIILKKIIKQTIFWLGLKNPFNVR